MRSERIVGQLGLTRALKRTCKLTDEELKKLRSIGGPKRVAEVMRMGHDTAAELLSPNGMVTAATIARVRARLAEVMVG